MTKGLDPVGPRLLVITAALGMAVGAMCLDLRAETVAADGPHLLPTPKSLKIVGGEMPLTAKSRIIAADPSLQPLAAILSDEIGMLTGLRLAVADGAPQPGDILLRINPQLRAGEDILAVQKEGGRPTVVRTRDFAHRITVSDTAVVEGWDYRAVCEGTATVLQAVGGKSGNHSLPRMTIQDWPHADYTGTLVDVARQRIPVDVLKAVVEACRLWKIRYCQLHLTDNEGFTFPSTAFPRLGTQNTAMHEGVVPKVYGLQELRDLVAFADARGVTLVPELATPNHSEALCRAMPEVFAGPKILNIINDDMYKHLDTLVGEMCEVFKSSPYFHMGGEEPYFFEIEESPATRKYMESKGFKAFPEVVVQHQARMIAMIRKRGKMTLAWEGGTVQDPKQKDDMIILCWIPYPTVGESQKMGFTTITVPWERGVSLQQWDIYNCNGVNLTAANKVLGGAVTMWQMSASAVVSDFLGGDLNGSSAEGYIRSLGDHMEGAWAPMTKTGAAEHEKRLAASRAKLEALLFPVRITGGPIAYRAWPVVGSQCFSGAVEVRLSLTDGVGGGDIRYTLDGSEPTTQSPVYAAPLAVEETTTVHAALFRNGRQVGAVSRAVYERLGDDGSIARWLIAGPYTMPGKKATDLFDVAFDPETSGKAQWKPYGGGTVKFSDVPGFGGNDRVAYMKTQIYSPKAQKARLLVASDDGAKVFLNGKVVHTANVERPAFNADTIDVSLREGWNQLLVKVTNASGGWEAWAKIRSADGGRLEKMRVKAE